MKNIVELIKQQALLHPNHIAFKDESSSLTFEELFLLVIEKASYIKELGIVNSPILVKVNRNIETLVSFFAILLSNNSYIPVDEDIPFEKLDKIISISNVKHYISFVDDCLPITKINYKKPSKIYDFSDFEAGFDVENDSYIMFTSGSTGTPKGVIKSHLNIISFVNNFTDTFSFLGQERIANQTPFFFDASAKDIYLSIKLGATLFIPSKSRFSLPMETIKYLNDNQITYVCWVPSILTMIAKTRTLNYAKPEYLKYVFFVGEVFQVKYFNMWYDALPNIRYFNIYGSTEVMGVSLYYEVSKHFDKDILPTGKTIKNNKVYLKEGEIIIDSPQTAKGYIGNSDNKTFKDIDGHHLLYTGDYAFLDEEGNIVFSTRKDFQIKHLGYRIELQEIEATLINLDYIEQCCAIYDENNDKIVLFVSLNKEIDNPSKVIISDAKEKLQFYMVPNKVVVLDEIPLNSNGKIDRNLLRENL